MWPQFCDTRRHVILKKIFMFFCFSNCTGTEEMLRNQCVTCLCGSCRQEGKVAWQQQKGYQYGEQIVASQCPQSVCSFITEAISRYALDCSGWYNKISQNGWFTLYSHISGACNSKVKVLAALVSGKHYLFGLQMVFPWYMLQKRKNWLPSLSPYKNINYIDYKAPSLGPHLRVPNLQATFGVRVSKHRNFGRTQYFRSLTGHLTVVSLCNDCFSIVI